MSVTPPPGSSRQTRATAGSTPENRAGRIPTKPIPSSFSVVLESRRCGRRGTGAVIRAICLSCFCRAVASRLRYLRLPPCSIVHSILTPSPFSKRARTLDGALPELPAARGCQWAHVSESCNNPWTERGPRAPSTTVRMSNRRRRVASPRKQKKLAVSHPSLDTKFV